MKSRGLALIAGGVVLIAGAVGLLVLTHSSSAPDPAPVQSERRPHTLPAAPQLAEGQPAPPDPVGAAAGAAAGSGSAADDEAPIDRIGGIEALSADVAQRHWPDALADCKDPQIAVVGATSCTLVACQMHSFPQARSFLAHVPAADRNDVIAQCDALHVMLRATPHSMFGRGHGMFHAGGTPPAMATPIPAPSHPAQPTAPGP